MTRYYVVFADGQTTVLFDLAYVTIITAERIHKSKIVTINGHSVY